MSCLVKTTTPFISQEILVVGFGLALIVNVIVSLLSKKPSKEIIDEFDSIKNIEV